MQHRKALKVHPTSVMQSQNHRGVKAPLGYDPVLPWACSPMSLAWGNKRKLSITVLFLCSLAQYFPRVPYGLDVSLNTSMSPLCSRHTGNGPGKSCQRWVYKHSLIHIFENCFHSKQWLQSTFSCWQLDFIFLKSLCILYLPNRGGIDLTHTHKKPPPKTKQKNQPLQIK